MEPFKVTFKLASPLFMDSEYPVHLDALLAYASVQAMEAEGITDSWSKADDYMLENAMLERTDGPDWVWKASKLFVNAASEIMFTNQIRKSDPEMYFDDLVTESNPDGVLVTGFMKDGTPRKINPETYRINTTSGQERGYQWLAASRWVADVVAYGIGDIDQVACYLTDHIKHLGKVGRNGLGRVASITVTPHDVSDDWMLRVLPERMAGKSGQAYATVQACIRAPYWRKTDRVIAKEPII